MKTPKVFGIGFHKTGTKSLGEALRTLGYRVTGPNGTGDPKISQNVYAIVDRLAPRYDAFQDNPWPVVFKYADEKYPGSKFILTLRPEDEWLQSVVRHFGTDRTPMREWIYGYGAPRGNEGVYVERYQRHNREVLEYFQKRPNDLLVLNLTRGEGWPELCRFLDLTEPQCPFPHANDAQARERMTGRWWHRIYRTATHAVRRARRLHDSLCC
jgi:sulfotransferase family protein